MTMQPDLTQPGAADAFDTVVSLFADAAARDDTETMKQAGARLRRAPCDDRRGPRCLADHGPRCGSRDRPRSRPVSKSLLDG